MRRLNKKQTDKFLSVACQLKELQYALNQFSAFTVSDAAGKITESNALFSTLSQYTRDELTGQDHRFLNSGFHSMEFFASMWQTILSGQTWHGDIRNRRKDGTFFWTRATIVPLTDRFGKPKRFMAFREDISQEKDLQEQLHHIAFYDQITDLPNQAWIRRFTTQQLNRHPEIDLCLLLIQVHPYHEVMRNLGRGAGEAILKETGRRLLLLSDTNRTFARIEANEFAVVLVGMNHDSSVHVQEALLGAFEKASVKYENIHIPILITVGITSYPLNGQTPDQLYTSASQALAQVSVLDDNPILAVTPTASMESFKSFSLAGDFLQALQENQFRLVFQPKFEVRSQSIVGAEALLRWDHPTWGTMSPPEFWTVVRELRMEATLNRWAFDTLCQIIQKWQADALEVPRVSFNLAGSALFHSELPDELMQVTSQHGVSPTSLEIEITETESVRNPHTAREILESLKKMGFSIAIDDFGSGFSSLTYLREFPADVVKIDRVFIQNLLTDPVSEAIVGCVVTLAEALHLSVLAEGVETPEILERVKHLGIDLVQGFLLGQPVPPEEFATLLTQPVDASVWSTPQDYSGNNRRHYFRVNIPQGLKATIAIERVHDREVSSGSSPIIIENIGAGGLRFLSKLKIPIGGPFIFASKVVLNGRPLTLRGHVIWFKEVHNRLLQYGLTFDISESDRDDLVSELNRLAIKLRTHPHYLAGYDLLDVQPAMYFRS